MSLFKYVHQDRVDILQKLQIRFTQASSQNDLFEFRPLTRGFKPRDEAIRDLADRLASHFRDADTPEKMLRFATANHPDAEASFRSIMNLIGAEKWLELMRKTMEDSLESEANRLCLHIEENWEQYAESIFEKMTALIGILSLTEDPNNIVMWGNYANSGQGFVIEFDEKHPWFNQKRSEGDEFRHLRQVTYVSNPFPRYFSELTGHDVCYSKLADWSYEREWRMLHALQDGINTGAKGPFGEPVIVFDLPSDCIAGVVLGPRTSDRTTVAVENALQNQGLRHIKLSRFSKHRT